MRELFIDSATAARRAYVRRLVAGFPPLTEAEKDKLAPLWRPGVIAAARARGVRL